MDVVGVSQRHENGVWMFGCLKGRSLEGGKRHTETHVWLQRLLRHYEAAQHTVQREARYAESKLARQHRWRRATSGGGVQRTRER